MLRLRLKSSSCCSGLVFETDCETEVVCVLGLEVGADRECPFALQANREEEKDEACETTTVAWLAGAAAIAARERRNQGCFLKLWALPPCCSQMFFHRSLWNPLRWGAENIRRYVDLTGYLQLKSGLCSKMPPRAVLSIFLHKPKAGPHYRTGFLRSVVLHRFLGFSLYWSTGKFKKKRSSLLEHTTSFRFRLNKRKSGMPMQNDRRRKSKKWPKDVVYVSSHVWLWCPMCMRIAFHNSSMQRRKDDLRRTCAA